MTDETQPLEPETTSGTDTTLLMEYSGPTIWPEYERLSLREKTFVNAILETGVCNLVRAAEICGYTGKDNVTLSNTASRIINRPHVRAALDAVLRDSVMSKVEVLAHYSDIARNSTPASVCRQNAKGQYVFSLDHAIKTGTDRFIKSVRVQGGNLTLTLHERMEALRVLAQYHGLVVNRNLNVGISAEDIARMSPEQLEQLAGGKRPDGY